MTEEEVILGESKPRPGLERRSARRYVCRLDVPARLILAHRFASRWAMARDISAFGISCLTSGPLEPGNLILLQWQGGPDYQPLALLAEVVYAVPQADGQWLIGCRFDNITGDLSTAERLQLQNLFRQSKTEAAEMTVRADMPPALAHRLYNPFAPVFKSSLREPGGLDWEDDLMDWQERQKSRRIADLFDLFLIQRNKIQLHRERVNLAEVVAHAYGAVQPLFESLEQRFYAAVWPEPLFLEVDTERLERTLVNLLIHTARTVPAGEGVWLILEQHRDGACLRLGSSGGGLTTDMLERADDQLLRYPEPTLTQLHSDLGIGLVFARKVVELHGGKISTYWNSREAGSELAIDLPLAGPA